MRALSNEVGLMCDVESPLYIYMVKPVTGLIQTHLFALMDNTDRLYPTERFDILSDKRSWD